MEDMMIQILMKSETPLRSGVIREELKDKGCDVSKPTILYHLRKLEKKGDVETTSFERGICWQLARRKIGSDNETTGLVALMKKFFEDKKKDGYYQLSINEIYSEMGETSDKIEKIAYYLAPKYELKIGLKRKLPLHYAYASRKDFLEC